MRFEWDPRKAESNYRKHGVDFELAEFVFDDPLVRVQPNRIVPGEERYVAIGMAKGKLVHIVFTHRDDSYGEEIVRIISARKPTRSERRDYERGT